MISLLWSILTSFTFKLVTQSVQFSRSVVSNSLRPHEPQNARPLCPSPTPRIHPNPCPSSWWCHLTISSTVIPFSPCPQSFPVSGSFPMSWLTGRRANLSILKKINPEYSLKGLMLKLKIQHFGPWCAELTHWKRPWCWERLRAGGEGGDRAWDGWMASPTQWTWIWANCGR